MTGFLIGEENGNGEGGVLGEDALHDIFDIIAD
jgi:hypothetical protein